MKSRDFFNKLIGIYIGWAIGTIIGLIFIMTLGDNFNRLIETGHWNRQPQYAIHFVHNSSSGYAANIACNGYIKASDMLETDSTFTAVVWTPTDSVVTKEILERKFIEKCSDITFPTILY